MGFIINSESPSLIVNYLGNFINYPFTLRGFHHPVLRLRAQKILIT